MKQIIFSTLHDPEGKLDLIQEMINQNVPGKLAKDYEKWVVAVSKATYVGKGKELIDKLKKLKGVDVVIEEGEEFCENPSRNNHYLGMRRASELAKELGAGYCFYADADRVFSELMRNGEVFSILKKSMDRLLLLPEGKELDLISVIRDMRWETWARQITEEPLNRLISMIGGVRVDTMGSYMVMSQELMNGILRTFPSRKEGGLPFPATEWCLEAIKNNFGIASWQSSEAMGGFELDSDYGRLSPPYILGNTIGRVLKNKNKELDKARNPLVWDLSERERLVENLVSSNKWELTREIDEDLYSDMNRNRSDWRKRIETALRHMNYISSEVKDGRLSLDEGSLDLHKLIAEHLVDLNKKIDLNGIEELRDEGRAFLKKLDARWPERKLNELHIPYYPEDDNWFSTDRYGRLFLVGGKEMYILEREGFRITSEQAEKLEKVEKVVGGVYEGVIRVVNKTQEKVGWGDKEKK